MNTSKIRRNKLTLAATHGPSSFKAELPEPVLDTKSMFKGFKELKIHHNSEIYRLSITKLGKLILTK